MISREESKRKMRELVEFYDKNKEKFKGMSETDTRIKFIDRTFEFLGWDVFGTKISDEVQREESVKFKTSKLKRVDYVLKINGLSKIVVEAKSLGEDLDKDEYIKQIYEYAHNKPCSWAILTNFKQVKIFYADRDSFSPFYSIDVEDVTNFDDNFETLWLISKESSEKNSLDIEVKRRGVKKDKIPLDQQLFSDLKRWREILSKDIKKRYLDKYDPYTIDEIVQRIIDRIIFIRKAEDSELEERTLDQLTRRFNENTYKELKKIFLEYNEKYNSKLFGEDKKSIHEADLIEISNDVIEDVIRSTYKPKGSRVEYNFAVIGANILGNIYEQYLAYILTKTPKKNKLEGGKIHRKEQGIYYTPTYIVDYIVKNTLGELLKDKKINPDKIKILDPACGSGSFLIRAFDYLVDFHLKKGKITQTKLDTSGVSATYTKKVDILKNNIYGVDLDTKAVEITQLNLLLKIAERGHRLPLLQQNIKCGNSLIEDEKIAGNRAFKWENEFEEIIKNGKFDVIIGNPPYGADLKRDEFEYFKKNYVSSEYKIDTYGLFIEKSINLLKDGGYFGFIIPNTILTNNYFKEIRLKILNECQIISLIGFDYYVFQDAKIDSLIIILKKEPDKKKRNSNKLTFIKINELIELHSFESKKLIKQYSFYENAQNQFNIDLRVDSKVMQKIKNCSENSFLENFVNINLGFRVRNNKDMIHSNNRGNDVPILHGKDIKKYGIIFQDRWFTYSKDDIVGGCSKREVYEAKEKLLIQAIRNIKLKRRIIATYDDSQFFVIGGLLSATKKIPDVNLKYILALLNSKLMNFYFRSLSIDKNIKVMFLNQLPIKKPNSLDEKEITNLVNDLLSLNKKLSKNSIKTDEKSKMEEEIIKKENKIDDLIYKIYGLMENEISSVENIFK